MSRGANPSVGDTSRRSARTRGLVIACVAVAAILASCGGASGRAADTSFTLYVGNVESSLPSTFMPWLSNQGIAPTISSSIYSTLFVYNDESDEFEPNLAKRWSYVQDPELVPADQDYLEVRIELDESATWSDGEAATADDVYFTFDLASDFGRTNHAGALAWTGDLLHTYERDRDGDWNLIRQGVFTRQFPGDYEFAADDENVVYFHVRKVLGAVTPLFTTILVLPEHLWNVVSTKNQLNSPNPIPLIESLFKEPIGSGPYTLDTEQTNAGVIVLQKRDDFHLTDDAGENRYKPETIKFINYLDVNVAINALKQGDIDVLLPAVDSAFVENLTAADDVEIAYSPGRYLTTLVLNVNAPPQYATPARGTLSDPVVREAIALAIDQQALIDQVLRGKGRPAPAGLIDTASYLYNPAAGVPEADRDRAREILDSAGYLVPEGGKFREKDGVKLSYAITAAQAHKNLVNYIKVQLESIGVEVYFEEGGSNATKDRYYTGDFDMTIQGVIFDLTNIDLMMNAHFVTVGSSSNYGRLEDPALSVLIEEMRTTLDPDAKVELIRSIQTLIAGEHYKLPLYVADVISAHRTDIYEGWTAVRGTTVYNDDTLENLQFK